MPIIIHIAIWVCAISGSALLNSISWLPDPVYYLGIGFSVGVFLNEVCQ